MEINGDGNSYTAEFWEYDSRIGRRWNLDPRPITGVSEYSAFNNSPILHADNRGDTSEPTQRPGWGQKGLVNLAKYKVGSLKGEGNIINKAGAVVHNWVLAPIGNTLVDVVDGIGNPGWTIYNIGEGIGNGFTSLGRWFKNNPDPIAGANIEISNAYNYAKENWDNPDAHLKFATMAWGVFGGGFVSSNISITQNFTLKSSGVLASGGLFRKVATNTGEFSSLEVPMSLKSVKRYAREADIGLSGIKIKINRDAGTMAPGFTGLAAGKRTIVLFPLAFKDVENLIKTLGHERTHIWQYKTFGLKNVQNNAAYFEAGAYGIENEFWNYTKNKKK